MAALRALLAELGAAQAPLEADVQRLFTTTYLLSRGRPGATPVALDAGSLLFVSLAHSTADVARQPDGSWRNTVTHSRPLVFHGNGRQDGRSELFLWEEVAGPQEPASAPAPPEEPPPLPPGLRLFIATPMYGGMAHGAYILALLELVSLLRDQGVAAQFDTVMNESLITRARNNLAASFLACAACTHLLFVDADVGFSAPTCSPCCARTRSCPAAPTPRRG